MAAPLALAARGSVGALVACSGGGLRPEEGLGSSDHALARESLYGGGRGTVVTTDAGTIDASKVFTAGGNLYDLSPAPPPPCAPLRWDVVVSGRTCFDLARRTATGLWTVSPLYPDAPAEIRNTHCAVIFTPNASATCAYPNIDSDLGLSCKEMHASAMRSAECAANPAACDTSGALDPATPPEAERAETDCSVVAIDGGSGGGSVGGCDSCGTVSGGLAYITNPYSLSSITVGLKTPTGVTPVTVSGAPHSSFVVPVGSGYTPGSVSVWF
jgi:hypothetical protein